MKQNVIDDYNLLSGQQKAAILMLSLDEDRSAALFSLMDDEEIKELSVIMASLGKINSNIVEQLIAEFNEKINDTGSLVGTYESTERLLAKALDKDRVSVIMEEIRGPAGRTMWDKLGNVNEHVLANYLKNEYPQTIAVILSKIKAEHAAKVIALFPENFAMEIVMRMLRMDSVQKEVLDSLEKTLRKEFMSNLSKSTRRDAHELIADIFNSLDRNTEGRFMDALEERNRESAERVKSLMFTFEDLVRIDSQGIQILLRNIDKDKLAIALKGASETVKELFFNNMSTRAGKIIKEDMDAMGPVRMRDVEEAQQYVVSSAKDLANSGEIIISEGSGSDEMVY
ncbi:MAG: flagellar motor switch protein FliG [bacterium]|nr:flagellar motor switch protein FliG [bacterium]MDY2830152.1 flagellar motor switch protein FliG [Alphaproteobacteria bacterium]